MADRPKGSWARRYPPMLSIGAALLLALVVLPSALNIPQTNPTTTLQYAPVPPEDQDVPPPGGNFSSLGFGSSGLGSGDGTTGGGPGGQAPSRGRSPTAKRCVGNPPRQTEDLLSPPCVAFFEGDNGGKTHRGVTSEEIRVVLYAQGGISWISSRGLDNAPAKTYWDINEPGGEDLIWIRGVRAFQRYFNNRFQTYGRKVHFWVHFSPRVAESNPETRRADAADELKRIDPFAVIVDAEGRHEEPYMEVHAKQNVLNFNARYFRPAEFYRSFRTLFWGYLPSAEHQADQYASFVCTKVLPHRVSFGGNVDKIGQPRVLGFLRTTDPEYPALTAFSKLAKQKIEACGGRFAAEGTFPEHFSIYNQDRNPPSYAVQNMADFSQKGVTTVIWPGGFESNHSRAAAQIGYRPEWILAGDGTSDGATAQAHQEKSVWQHAWIVSNVTMEPSVTESECYRALREADPEIPHEDAREMCSFSDYYEAIRQLYTGIQVAGPRVNPGSIDRGFHAIRPVRSTDPSVPACFFEPSDYTCVKDAEAMWYDPSGESGVSTAPGNSGCWRGGLGGKRYLAWEWPEGDVLTLKRESTDPCNSFGGQVSLR